MASSSATEAGHFGKARVNLLLGLLQDIDELTSLFLVLDDVVSLRVMTRRDIKTRTYCQW